MDGTLYIDDELLSGTAEFLQGIKGQRRPIYFMTNNSSKGSLRLYRQTEPNGRHGKAGKFLTSADASAELLEDRKREKMYVMGTESFKRLPADFRI